MIIYLPGSANDTNIVHDLHQRFGIENVVLPGQPMMEPTVLIRSVNTLIADQYRGRLRGELTDQRTPNHKVIFLGNGLGGLYATYFGMKYDCPMVLVNPSVPPGESANTDKVGITKEELLISLSYIDVLRYMRDSIDMNYDGSLVNLFVAKDDEVIPYNAMIAAYPYHKSLLVTDTGGHEFTGHWDKVFDKIQEIS